MHDWQVYNMRTCAPPVMIRVIPENEIPPAIAGGFLLYGFWDTYQGRMK